MNLIGISGKIRSGKDSVAKIINTLTFLNIHRLAGGRDEHIFYEPDGWSWERVLKEPYGLFHIYWESRRFADALKDIVCIMLNCSRQQLEDETFKNSLLPDEWQIYQCYNGTLKTKWFVTEQEAIEYTSNKSSYNARRYEKSERTVRWLLQYIGTELFRERIHPNIHVNMLFSNYVSRGQSDNGADIYPYWLIPDLRFPNEAEAIKKRGGLLVRVNKLQDSAVLPSPHPSEIGLDNYKEFDYTIDNNGSIIELKDKVLEIMLKEGML